MEARPSLRGHIPQPRIAPCRTGTARRVTCAIGAARLLRSDYRRTLGTLAREIRLGVWVGVGVAVGFGVSVAMGVIVNVAVRASVGLAVGVLVGVAASVGVAVGVAFGGSVGVRVEVGHPGEVIALYCPCQRIC